MLKLYYSRFSLFARPVWLALLEKRLEFELIPMQLDGDQFELEFFARSPFSQIPVLIDDGFRVIESGAILDYLEAKYPTPALLPEDAESIAVVRMVQMVAINKLLPAIATLLIRTKEPQEMEFAHQQITIVLTLFEELLGNHTYFGGEQVTLAEIFAGTLVPSLPRLDVSLTPYPKIFDWSERLAARDTWQRIHLTPEEFDTFRRKIKLLPRIWRKRRQQRASRTFQATTKASN
ncbi:MAG: glutathione S-transferase family protein [Cyanothece sp. SIO1E1]|nr:glutathione S-transferase family protein [Cyanothece sp. SIO1E1]